MEFKFVKIISVDMLKELSTHTLIECFIELNKGLRSSKTVFYDAEEEKFYITNNIDDTEQVLTEEELFTESNIGEAIIKGCFWQCLEYDV